MGELYRISRKLDKAENRQKHLNYLNGERLYDNQEVCQLLRISKRTLQRYRNNGALKFHSIYHKTYYKESDLHEFIRNNFDENEIKRQARKDKLSETLWIMHLGCSSFRDIAYRCEAGSSLWVKQPASFCREDRVKPFFASYDLYHSSSINKLDNR